MKLLRHKLKVKSLHLIIWRKVGGPSSPSALIQLSTSINDIENILGNKCIEVCPRKNATVTVFREDVNARLSIVVAVSNFVGIYGLTNIDDKILTDTSIASSTSEETSTIKDSSNTSQIYKNGTYTGSGSGFKGITKISVAVFNGKISLIQTVSNQDTPKYYQRVKSTITNSIILKQSTSIDTISGAIIVVEE